MDVEKALLPLAPLDHPWDGAEAVKRLRSWAGGPAKEEIDWKKYAKGFALVDEPAEGGPKFGDFHLPFADVLDGEARAVYLGCAAVVGALNGARGASYPEETRAKIYRLMKSYYKAFDKEIPELKSASDLPAAHPFQLTVPIVRYQVEKADGEEHHFVEGAASDTSEDFHGDRMAATTIVKFVEYVAQADPPIDLDVEHSEDWTDQIGTSVEAAVLYEVPAGIPGEPPVFWVKLEVDTGMSHGQDLVAALKKGKKLGLSIAGDVIAYHVEKDGTRILDHVRLYKIAVTKQPANKNTWLAHVTKSLPQVEAEAEPNRELIDEPLFEGRAVQKQEAENMPDWWLTFEGISELNDIYGLLQSLNSVVWNIFDSKREDKRALFDKALSAFGERMGAIMEAKQVAASAEFSAAFQVVAVALGVDVLGLEVSKAAGVLLEAAQLLQARAPAEHEPELLTKTEPEPCACAEGGPRDGPEPEPEPEPEPVPAQEPATKTEPKPEPAPAPSQDDRAAEALNKAVEAASGSILQAAQRAMQEGLAPLTKQVTAQGEQLTSLAGSVRAMGEDLEARLQRVEAQPVGKRGINPNVAKSGPELLLAQYQEAKKRGDRVEMSRLFNKLTEMGAWD